MVLDLVNTCSDAGLANVLAILKRLLDFLQLFGPIVAIISLVIIFIKLMSNPDNKKLKGNIKNCLLALAIMFLVPTFVNIVMGLLDDRFELSACWNKAESFEIKNEAEFIEDNDGRVTDGLLVDPSDYESGDARSNSDDDSSNNNNNSSNSADVDSFLKSLDHMSNVVTSEANVGKPWKYSNKNNKNTFEKADSTVNSTNCALYVVWGLVDIGILDSGDRFYKHKSDTIKYARNAKSKLESKMQYIDGKGKTAKTLINNGTLKAGDIVLWKNQQHTNVYAGNNKWYDAGRQKGINGSGSSNNYKFKTLGPVKISYYMNTKVWKILRIK